MTETTLVVDGSNIATEGRSVPSLQQLDEAVTAFIAERPHDVVIVVVDATFGHRIDPSELPRFEEAVLDGELVTPPAGAIGRGDAFILQIADRAGANVFSNDSFQEFHGTYDWLFEPGRLVGGKPVPPIGWVFIDRTPVRGPTSRRAVRESKQKAAKKSAASNESSRRRQASPDASGPPPVPTTPPPGQRRAAKTSAAKTSAAEPSATKPGATKSTTRTKSDSTASATATTPARTPDRTKSSRPPVNEPLPFLNFVTEYSLGDVVTGEVVEFSSHGAYVLVGDTRCYVPVKSLGSPPPRSARDVLTLGEVRSFEVQRFDTAHRGVDLGLHHADGSESSDPAVVEKSATNGEAPRSNASSTNDQQATDEHAEEATLATKAPAKKAPAKKAPATKTTSQEGTSQRCAR